MRAVEKQKRYPNMTGKGQELLSACEQFESAAKENMEKLYDTYLRDVL